jgi:hypothetical protein
MAQLAQPVGSRFFIIIIIIKLPAVSYGEACHAPSRLGLLSAHYGSSCIRSRIMGHGTAAG